MIYSLSKNRSLYLFLLIGLVFSNLFSPQANANLGSITEADAFAVYLDAPYVQGSYIASTYPSMTRVDTYDNRVTNDLDPCPPSGEVGSYSFAPGNCQILKRSHSTWFSDSYPYGGALTTSDSPTIGKPDDSEAVNVQMPYLSELDEGGDITWIAVDGSNVVEDQIIAKVVSMNSEETSLFSPASGHLSIQVQAGAYFGQNIASIISCESTSGSACGYQQSDSPGVWDPAGTSITFNEDKNYLGFWWSAGSLGNVIKLYQNNALVYSLSVNDVCAIVGNQESGSGCSIGSGKVRAIDATT